LESRELAVGYAFSVSCLIRVKISVCMSVVVRRERWIRFTHVRVAGGDALIFLLDEWVGHAPLTLGWWREPIVIFVHDVELRPRALMGEGER